MLAGLTAAFRLKNRDLKIMSRELVLHSCHITPPKAAAKNVSGPDGTGELDLCRGAGARWPELARWRGAGGQHEPLWFVNY